MSHGKPLRPLLYNIISDQANRLDYRIEPKKTSTQPSAKTRVPTILLHPKRRPALPCPALSSPVPSGKPLHNPYQTCTSTFFQPHLPILSISPPPTYHSKKNKKQKTNTLTYNHNHNTQSHNVNQTPRPKLRPPSLKR